MYIWFRNKAPNDLFVRSKIDPSQGNVKPKTVEKIPLSGWGFTIEETAQYDSECVKWIAPSTPPKGSLRVTYTFEEIAGWFEEDLV